MKWSWGTCSPPQRGSVDRARGRFFLYCPLPALQLVPANAVAPRHLTLCLCHPQSLPQALGVQEGLQRTPRLPRGVGLQPSLSFMLTSARLNLLSVSFYFFFAPVFLSFLSHRIYKMSFGIQIY